MTLSYSVFFLTVDKSHKKTKSDATNSPAQPKPDVPLIIETS